MLAAHKGGTAPTAVSTDLPAKTNGLGHLLKPIQLCSLVFGYFEQPARDRALKLLYNLLFFVLLVLGLIHELPSIRFWINKSGGIHGAIVKLEAISRWFLYFQSYVVSVAYRSRVLSVRVQLQEVDIQLPDHTLRRTFRAHVAHLVVNTCFILFYDVYGYCFTWSTANYSHLTTPIYILTDFVILWGSFEFVHMMNSLRICFKQVNRRLRQCSERGASGLVKYAVQEDIRRYRSLHLTLCTVTQRVGGCFGVQVLSVLFLSLVEAIYALRSMVQDANSIQTYPVDFSMNIVWVAFYVIMTFQPIVLADVIKNESEETSVVVHQLINDYYYEFRIVKELEHFSLQMSQQQSSCSVLGLFDLNLPVLTTFLGTLTTYFIMTVTFDGEWNNGALAEWEFDYSNA